MTISFFGTLEAVLTQAIADICRTFRIDEEEAVERAKKFLAENTAAYWSPNPDLRYDDPLCRWAYLYSYVGAHANLMDNALRAFPALGHLVTQQMRAGDLHVCSLGGGPGSELLGLTKFIQREYEEGDRIDINFILLDKIAEWDETWHGLVTKLEATFRESHGSSRRDWPIVVHRSFLSLDLTQVLDFQHLVTRFNDVQLYVLNHTVSELKAYGAEFVEVFSSIVDRASDGAYFLFIDTNYPDVVGLIDQAIGASHLSVVDSQVEQTNLDEDEIKEHLGRWYRLMERDPKLQWNAVFKLARKPDEIPF